MKVQTPPIKAARTAHEPEPDEFDDSVTDLSVFDAPDFGGSIFDLAVFDSGSHRTPAAKSADGAVAPSSIPPSDSNPASPIAAISLDEATRRCEAANHLSDLEKALLHFAVTKARRAVVLRVRRGAACGWESFGLSVSREILRQFTLPLEELSTFQLVVNSGAPFVGPINHCIADRDFLRMAGRIHPGSSALLPIRVRQRVTYILYLDNGHGQYVDSDLSEMQILSLAISRAIERLAVRKRA